MYSWNQVIHNCTTGQPYSLASLNSDKRGPFSTWAWKLPDFPTTNYVDVASGKPFSHPDINLVRKLLSAGLIKPDLAHIHTPDTVRHTPKPPTRTKQAKPRRLNVALKVKGP